MEALLSYYLSWFILHGRPKDGIYPFFFPIAIILVKEGELALEPIYFGSLYTRMDECITNVARSFKRYDVVTHVNLIHVYFLMGDV